MQGVNSKGFRAGLAWAIAVFLGAGAAVAESEPPAATPPDPQLETQLAAEKNARKQCKTDICKAFATRSADGGAIACDITKTFLGADISQKILSGKIAWPWGNAQCATRVELDRAALVKLVSEPDATVKLKAHELKCTVDKGVSGANAAQSYLLKMSIAPEVTFKNGRAASVKLNWSNINAPLLAQGAIWSAATVDSALNVMGSSAVAQVNEFIYDHCKDVGVEVAQPK